MKTNPNESAFPEVQNEPQFNTHTYGLTKREYFAGLAMQGLSSIPLDENKILPMLKEAEITLAQACAIDAVEYADALIEALNQEQENEG